MRASSHLQGRIPGYRAGFRAGAAPGEGSRRGTSFTDSANTDSAEGQFTSIPSTTLGGPAVAPPQPHLGRSRADKPRHLDQPLRASCELRQGLPTRKQLTPAGPPKRRCLMASLSNVRASQGYAARIARVSSSSISAPAPRRVPGRARPFPVAGLRPGTFQPRVQLTYLWPHQAKAKLDLEFDAGAVV